MRAMWDFDWIKNKKNQKDFVLSTDPELSRLAGLALSF